MHLRGWHTLNINIFHDILSRNKDHDETQCSVLLFVFVVSASSPVTSGFQDCLFWKRISGVISGDLSRVYSVFLQN